MPHLSATLAALLCCATLACSRKSDAPTQPPESSPPSAFRIVEVSPTYYYADAGSKLQIGVVARDEAGKPMTFDPAHSLSFTSSDPSIATVSPSGLLTTLAAGSVEITAKLTVAGVTKSGRLYGTIFPVPALTSIAFSLNRYGWLPGVNAVAVNGLVTWSTEQPTTPSGTRVEWLYISEHGHSISDSVDLRSGKGSYRFAKAGTYDFCAGGCWDPPEGGTIYVK